MAILLASVGLFQLDVTNSGTGCCSDGGWMGGNVLFTTLSSQTSARLPALSKLLLNPLVQRCVRMVPILRACRIKVDDNIMMCYVAAFDTA